MLKRLVTLLVLALWALPALSQSPSERVYPAPESDTLSDFARVLTPEEEERINRLLIEARDATGVQMVVVTMQDLALYSGAGMRLDAYAKALFNAWGVGDAERNDGILMLVLTDAREVRIALGAGYDAVYDGRAARVLTTSVLPAFREGRLAEGIEAGITTSREQLITPFLEGRPVTLTDGFEPESSGGGGVAPAILAIIAAVGGVIGLAMRSARKRRTCPNCGEQTLKRVSEVIEPATLISTGTGIEHLTCSNCGLVDRRSYTIHRSGRRSSTTRGAGGSGGGRSGGFITEMLS